MTQRRYLLLLALLLASFGCKQSVSTQNSGKGGLSLSPYISMGDIHAAGIDTTAIDGFLWFKLENDQNNSATAVGDTMAAATAIFGDSLRSGLIGVTSVSVNSKLLSNGGEALYNNASYSVFNPLTPTTASWSVSGYQGSTLTDNAPIPAIMNVSNLNPGDTVSESAGFTVNYTNYANGDLLIDAGFDGTFTYIWGDTSLAHTGHGSVNKLTSDNGSITLSSADLTGITTGGYITVLLIHYDYNVVTTSKGIPVGVLSSSATRIPLFLKP